MKTLLLASGLSLYVSGWVSISILLSGNDLVSVLAAVIAMHVGAAVTITNLDEII